MLCTVKPRVSSAAMTRLPTKPLPPVTRILFKVSLEPRVLEGAAHSVAREVPCRARPAELLHVAKRAPDHQRRARLVARHRCADHAVTHQVLREAVTDMTATQKLEPQREVIVVSAPHGKRPGDAAIDDRRRCRDCGVAE